MLSKRDKDDDEGVGAVGAGVVGCDNKEPIEALPSDDDERPLLALGVRTFEPMSLVVDVVGWRSVVAAPKPSPWWRYDADDDDDGGGGDGALLKWNPLFSELLAAVGVRPPIGPKLPGGTMLLYCTLAVHA